MARPLARFQTFFFSTNFTDFRVDAFSISSYSDAGQDPDFAGSVLAHGMVDNIVVTTPPLPVENLIGSRTNGMWEVRFQSQGGFRYALQGSINLHDWSDVSSVTAGNGAELVLRDTNSLPSNSFYRVRVQRP